MKKLRATCRCRSPNQPTIKEEVTGIKTTRDGTIRIKIARIKVEIGVAEEGVIQVTTLTEETGTMIAHETPCVITKSMIEEDHKDGTTTGIGPIVLTHILVHRQEPHQTRAP